MTIDLRCGDALALMREMPDCSVQTCVTSPPYWGLRDYGTAKWEGGDAACNHKGVALASSSSSLAGYTSEDVKIRTHTMPQGQTCAKCGARRIDAQLGLERTPQEYVERMVEVFREVRRVLRDDGMLWLNLGDSYAAGGPAGGAGKQHTNAGSVNVPTRSAPDGLKPKDLVGIPWRVAFALQADGWWLRSDIIWAKPNPMPESVTDRPTKSHEYLFLLTKSARYYYDAQAIAEPHADQGDTRRLAVGDGTFWANADKNSGSVHLGTNGPTRNARSVWTIATSPYSEAHFATFPPELPRRCILAGSKPGDTVLDPFAGAGTTGLVADRLGRSFIGLELNPEYVEIARRRIAADCPLFAQDQG